MNSSRLGDILNRWSGVDIKLTDLTTQLQLLFDADKVRRLMYRYSERVYIYEDDGRGDLPNFDEDFRLFLEQHVNSANHMYTALITDYKPLENYSMTESGTDTAAGTDTTTRTGTDTTTNGGTTTTEDTTATTTTNTGTVKDDNSGTATNAVAGYDSSAMSDRDKTTSTTTNTRTDNTTQTATNSGTITQTDDKTSTLSHNTTDATATSSNTSHTLTRSGNIGVTTSQQMLTSEIEVRAKHNVINYLIEIFISQYTIWG